MEIEVSQILRACVKQIYAINIYNKINPYLFKKCIS